MLGPAAITSALVDLGADVIKVEPPTGDYIRQMTWPIVEGVSLMHLHVNRGKRSIALDLRTEDGKRGLPRAGRATPMPSSRRCAPAALERLGLGPEACARVNPRIVFARISGYGITGPYKDYPSHGIAYDTWAGIVTPEVDDEGFTYIPEHVSIGIYAGPLVRRARRSSPAIIRARETGEGCRPRDRAVRRAPPPFDWYRSETWKAYERPEDEVTGNPSDDYERRAPGTAGMRDGVRYQIYETADGHVLFMASRAGVLEELLRGRRADGPVREAGPGRQYADHARGNRELQAELQRHLRARGRRAEWMRVRRRGQHADRPGQHPEDPRRRPAVPGSARLDSRRAQLGADQLPFPVKFVGEELPRAEPRRPTVGEHTYEVLRACCDYDDHTIAELRESPARSGMKS